eukprot:CAMPEP_0179049490 /NCGR_PEP_ID=MMETSP0796-20121207/20238_1 /TAXON_ID=73915 /ORGANISM="Pyrodinium bahamense, Strain pbaha01" /LENGTH=36 /DNA_ID= /DNA_START= /DNA_END= /DNA_ORIENTATION=
MCAFDAAGMTMQLPWQWWPPGIWLRNLKLVRLLMQL